MYVFTFMKSKFRHRLSIYFLTIKNKLLFHI